MRQDGLVSFVAYTWRFKAYNVHVRAVFYTMKELIKKVVINLLLVTINNLLRIYAFHSFSFSVSLLLFLLFTIYQSSTTSLSRSSFGFSPSHSARIFPHYPQGFDVTNRTVGFNKSEILSPLRPSERKDEKRRKIDSFSAPCLHTKLTFKNKSSLSIK